MIVVAIIALLASIAVPGFLRARKRSQASRIINDLRLIDNAVDMYAIENNKATGNSVPIAEWTKYMKIGTESLPHGSRHTWNDLRSLRPLTRCQRFQPARTMRCRTWPPIRSGRLITKLSLERARNKRGALPFPWFTREFDAY